jgi:YVTN family beta-propeller protein
MTVFDRRPRLCGSEDEQSAPAPAYSPSATVQRGKRAMRERKALLAAAVVAICAALLPGVASAKSASGGVEALVPVKPSPTHEVGGFGAVWVLSQGNVSYVSRVDATTNRVTAVVRLGYGELEGANGYDPLAIPITAGSGAVWTSDFFSNQVTRIDPSTAKIVARIDVGRSPTGIVAAFGDVFVANWQDASVSRIDPRVNRVVATIPVGDPSDFSGGPYSLALINGALWATVPALQEVVRIDPSSDRVSAVEHVAPALACGELLPAPHGLWINDANCSNTESRYDLSTHRVVASFTVSTCLLGAAVLDGYLYTAEDRYYPKQGSCFGGSLVKRSLTTGEELASLPVGPHAFNVFAVAGDLWTNRNAYFTPARNFAIRVSPFGREVHSR